jgi:hypothetical protein
MLDNNGDTSASAAAKKLPAKRVTIFRRQKGGEEVVQLVSGLDAAKREALAKTRRMNFVLFC